MEGCGQVNHTLLHFHERKEEVEKEEVNRDSMADQGTSCNTSTHSVSAVDDSSEVVFEVIPVKVAVKSRHMV